MSEQNAVEEKYIDLLTIIKFVNLPEEIDLPKLKWGINVDGAGVVTQELAAEAVSQYWDKEISMHELRKNIDFGWCFKVALGWAEEYIEKSGVEITPEIQEILVESQIEFVVGSYRV